jgi:hypothetical protein
VTTGSEKPPPGPSIESEDEMDLGPYGPRGKDTPPFRRLAVSYFLIFFGCIVLPFLLFLLLRFVVF